MSGLVHVMAMLARYTLPDDVPASANDQVREFCLACVDGLRPVDDEMRRLKRERDQAFDMLRDIELALGCTWPKEHNALDAARHHVEALAEAREESSKLESERYQIGDVYGYWDEPQTTDLIDHVYQARDDRLYTQDALAASLRKLTAAEATLAGVRALPAKWAAYAASLGISPRSGDVEDCADELADALSPSSTGGE